MTAQGKLVNEPVELGLLREYDQYTWWIGAIAREAAQLDLTANLILKALLQQDPKEERSPSGKDLMTRQVKREIKKVLCRPEVRSVSPELSSQIGAWIESLDSSQRNRVIHDIVAASNEGFVSFDSAQVLSKDYKLVVTREHLNGVFTEIQNRCREGEDLWTRADAAWRPKN